MSRLLKFFAIVFLCCFVAIACTRSPQTSTSDAGRITLGTTATISSIDPADTNEIFAGNILYNLGDRLYSYKLGTSELQPQLATAMPTISKDGLTYKIPLRKGVLFHDGTQFDAKAMAFSLQRFMDLKGKPSSILSRIVKKVAATGDYELTIQLKQPFAAFPSMLAFSGACAVSPKAYADGKFQSDKFVGTGAYKLSSFGTDNLRLEAFDQYWGGKPTNSGVNVQFFSSTANLFNAFRTGAVDVAYQSLGLDQVRNLQENQASRGWKVIERSGSGIDVLVLNLRAAPLDRLEVRQAIAAIMDRPLLQSRVFQGQIDPLYSLIPSSLEQQKPVFKELGDRNTTKAIELLKKAGYSETNPLKLEFWYRSNLSNDQMASITMKAIAERELGKLVQIDLQSVETATAYNNLDKGVYPIFLLDWAPDFLDADNYIQPFMECSEGSVKEGCKEGESSLWGSFYYSDRANQLISQSRQEQNPTTRKKMFEELQDILLQDVPFIPLWQNKDLLFVQRQIEGATLEVTQKVPFARMKKTNS